MDLEQLSDVINHPATTLGTAMLMLAAPYIYNTINETEIYGIPASNIIFAFATINIARGLVGCAVRFFPNEINLRIPVVRFENPENVFIVT